MSGFLLGNDVDSPPVDGFEKSELKTRESKYTFEPVCLKEIDEMSSFAEADMKYSKSTKMEIHSLKQIAAQEFILSDQFMTNSNKLSLKKLEKANSTF